MATSLELAITAIRSGRKEEGRQLLNLLIQQNPNNEMAWLWMSSVVNNDEQRARCLYHVLAINPNNELARRGLQLLGIVVSDSRPVRVPRDSQPIPIQKPQPEVSLSDSLLNPATLPAQPPQSQPPAQPVPQPVAPAPPGQPVPEAERRPFRLDPRTVTQELPFTPLREPFAETMRRSPSAFIPRAEINQPPPNAAPSGQPPVSAPGSPPATGVPSDPIPATNTGPLPNPTPGEQNVVAPIDQVPQVPPASPQSPLGSGPMSLQETRPSPPIWTTHSNVTMATPQPAPTPPAPYPTPGINSNVTMGMPPPYPQLPQPPPAIHSNATMGMAPPVPPGQPMPAEAMAALHSSATMGMPAYPPSPFPAPFPPNQVFHSSATMAMPTMTEAEARAHLLASQALAANLDPMAALRAAAASAEVNTRRPKSAKKGAKEDDDEEEEEVNLMAVIVFGSLSVTALGGLGMLVLLWFTSV